jgi:hypothetical protein
VRRIAPMSISAAFPVSRSIVARSIVARPLVARSGL